MKYLEGFLVYLSLLMLFPLPMIFEQTETPEAALVRVSAADFPVQGIVRLEPHENGARLYGTLQGLSPGEHRVFASTTDQPQEIGLLKVTDRQTTTFELTTREVAFAELVGQTLSICSPDSERAVTIGRITTANFSHHIR